MNIVVGVELFVYILWLVGLIFVVAGFVAMFAGPHWRGVPYVPTSRKRIEAMLEMSKVKPGEYVVDLGSGDGRIVIAFARHGAHVDGYELNPTLVFLARLRIWCIGYSSQANIHMRNYWHVDLSRFDIVTIFGFPPMMDAIRKKFERELRPGTRILSNSFQLPGWKSIGKKRRSLFV